MVSSLRWTSSTVVVLGLLISLASSAAAQIKPYFLVVVDTSGSMAWCAGGNSDCSCYASNNCNNALLTNRCGFPANRIGDAKCALQRIIDSTGDATFGLMQFKHNCSNSCAQPGSGSSCDAQLVVEIQQNNANLMREWVDGACQGTCTNDFTHELTTGQNTPIAQSLTRANQYLRGLVPVGNAWEYPTNPAGFNLAPASPIANDPQLACRPVSVILLTDGDDSCAANQTADPPAAAGVLNTGSVTSGTVAGKAFRTYVIGFGTGGNFDPNTLNNIAMMGGTDAPHPTNRYFAAANEAELSVALNQIIADAQAPVEICNDADDDCDGEIDEGLTKYCDLATGHAAKDLCTDPGETNCDGKDDNCDGLIDNGFGGVCSTCTASDTEVCDGIDNDCDLIIDEGTSSGDACGPSKGLCEPGQLQCIAGEESCEGGVGPVKESCDCEDNDCDGEEDEDSGNQLCGEGMRCAGCKCVPFCDTTAEFKASCPGDLSPEFQPNGECLCVESSCDAQACAKETVKRDGVVACAPNSTRAAACQCSGGECVPRCDGVMCNADQACDPRSGRCVEDSCRGLGCDPGKLCEPVSGECLLDECAGVTCEANEACRDGKCERSCAGVSCPLGEKCASGKCVADPCGTKSCGAGKTCDPDSGKCVENQCSTIACKTGQVCEVSSGECVANPCWNVDCPKDQICAQGECMFGGSNPVKPEAADGNSRLLATGGGGCACSVPGPAHGATSKLALSYALAVFGLVLARRQRKRGGRGTRARFLTLALLCLVALVASGCRVQPFCVDCVEKPADESPVVDGSVVLPDGRVIEPGDLDGGSADAQVGDGATPEPDGGTPQCVKTGVETCNDKDDDCDFKVDEDVTAKTNDCLQAGVCAHTKPVCVSGEFECHYASSDYEADESLCDGKDNDCDGKVDEPFADIGKPCQVGVGECRVGGSMQCAASGTSLRCEANASKAPSAELCDQKDNDCDGLVDEPAANKGSNPSFVDQTTVAAEICDGVDNDCDGKTDEPKGDAGDNASFVPEDVVQVSGSLWVHKYEASRPDATATSQGVLSTRACSRAGVLPWTNLSYQEAVDACTAAGMQVCKVADWITACEAGSNCGYAYTPASGTCDDTNGEDDAGDYVFDGANACVGHDVTAQPGDPDTDALAPTGSKARCFADHASGDIFDLSGNAKEWTTDPTPSTGSPAKNPLRGGSYNNAPAGLRCDFDFSVGGPTLRLPNIGFRCCSATNPN